MVCKSIHFMLMKLKKLKRKIRKFQDDECVKFQLDDENDHHPYLHMLVFKQMNDEFSNKITRTFLCKRIIENDTIQVLKCVDLTIQKDICGGDYQNKYFNIHICHASKLLKDCMGGCLFP